LDQIPQLFEEILNMALPSKSERGWIISN
jgi:hypothetical protein